MSRATTHAILRALRPTRGKLLMLLGLALVACGLYWWYDGGRWRFSPRHFGVVEPGVIYRSGRIHPALIEGVRRHAKALRDRLRATTGPSV